MSEKLVELSEWPQWYQEVLFYTGLSPSHNQTHLVRVQQHVPSNQEEPGVHNLPTFMRWKDSLGKIDLDGMAVKDGRMEMGSFHFNVESSRHCDNEFDSG